MNAADERVSRIRRDLHGNVAEVMTALGLLSQMELSDRVRVFEDILQLCLSPKFAANARKLVLSLPREWLLANIEELSEPFLQTADSRDYLMLLGLFDALDWTLARKLARKASLSADYDIREVGTDFLETKTGENDDLKTILKVKALASDVGGLKKLKALVDSLSESPTAQIDEHRGA